MTTILSALTQLIPIWSVEIIRYCRLGNEYSMLFSLVITNIVNLIANKLNETIIFVILGIIILFCILYKNKYFSLNFITTKNEIKFTTIETNNVVYMDEFFNKLNNYLIQTYKINKLKILKIFKLVHNN